MDLSDYEGRLSWPIAKKLSQFEVNGRLTHVLFAEQFRPSLLDEIGRTATLVRELAQNRESNDFLRSLLPHKRAMLYFTQTSTRTFLSFVAACQLLGMSYAELRDPSVSSEYKGESPLDSMRMFSSYFDIVIMRSEIPDFAESCAHLMNELDRVEQRSVPVVNGGSGADEHPTQALLDVYTIQRTFEFESPRDSSKWSRYEDLRSREPLLRRGLDGKSYAFCGDIGRGRTVRSLAVLLAQYEKVSLHFVSPPQASLRLPADLKGQLIAMGAEVFEHTSLEDVIETTDLLYMTRPQREHNVPGGESASADWSEFTLTMDRVERMKEYAPILHPFPRNDEIPIDVDRNPRAMYFRQARNGMWVRAALLAHLFNVDGAIAGYHASKFGRRHDYNAAALRS